MTCVLNRLGDGPTGLETWEIILDYSTDSAFGAVLRPGSIVLANVHPGELCARRLVPGRVARGRGVHGARRQREGRAVSARRQPGRHGAVLRARVPAE
jgi:hypothetical protein